MELTVLAHVVNFLTIFGNSDRSVALSNVSYKQTDMQKLGLKAHIVALNQRQWVDFN